MPGSRFSSPAGLTAIFVCIWLSVEPGAAPQRRVAAPQRRVAVPIRTSSVAVLRDWDRRVDSMQRAGELRVRQRRADMLVAGRTHDHRQSRPAISRATSHA